MKHLLSVLKMVYSYCEYFVVLLGCMLLVIIVVAGIAHAPLSIVVGYNVPSGNLTRLTQGNMPYYMGGILIIFIIGFFTKSIYSAIKAVKEYRQKKNTVTVKDNSHLLIKVAKWLITH